VRKSLFVTVLLTIACGMLWILFLAATRRSPVLDAGEMVRVEGGEWIDLAAPDRKIVVQPFLIDKYEVTNAQFARFRPEHKFREQQEDFPVTNISWEEAAAYAKWAGKQLPTETEWQLAAGAANGYRYPWGNEKRPLNLKSAKECQKVGHYRENCSPAGCYDMEGNVWEWTADHGSEQNAVAAADDSHVAASPQMILKGGWSQAKKSVAPAAISERITLHAKASLPYVGFRCVRRLQPGQTQ
jgi:formylglycine-generating enzyme required for sulfatase activity